MNKETDNVLKMEKAHISAVKRRILYIDIALAPIIIVLSFVVHDDTKMQLVASSVLTISSILFAYYSFKIGRVIKKATGYEPKNGLIFVHVVNMIIFSIGAAG